jgi:hypothetical protein
MSGFCRNIDPTPPHRPVSVYPPPPLAFGAGGDTLAGWRGDGGSIVRKTPDTALYSTCIYVSTLWLGLRQAIAMMTEEDIPRNIVYYELNNILPVRNYINTSTVQYAKPM